MKFYERIKQARKDMNLTQTDVSEYFQKYGFTVKPYAISSWETGKHKPDIDQFAVLCKIYKADPTYLLTGNKNNDNNILSGLNQKGQSHVLSYINLLKSDPIFTNQDETTKIDVRIIRLYDMPVSAGVGMYLGSENYEEISVDDSIPNDTDYAVRVKGDSMQPKFFDGDILFVREQQTLNDGEIGIFSLNGEAYVKKLINGSLVSLNSKYEPIRLAESDDLRVFGKVIGKN